MVDTRRLRARQRIGKYRLVRRLGEGGFATVWEAADTVEGVRVALKIPLPSYGDARMQAQLRREVSVHGSLDHPNILPIKSADLVDGQLLIAYPLGTQSLADRMRYRASIERIFGWADQMLAAVAFAHKKHVIHCDLKPENFILFPGDRLRLSDFGIARVAWRTRVASGSGTLGYIAPEQAMGRTSFRSDVFSLGLILWQLLARELPEWPFTWPLTGIDRVRRKVPREFVAFLQKALSVDEASRYANAVVMRNVFRTLSEVALGHAARCSECSGSLVRFARFCPHCRARVTRTWTIDGSRRRCSRCRWGVEDSWHACAWCGSKLPSRRRSS